MAAATMRNSPDMTNGNSNSENANGAEDSVNYHEEVGYEPSNTEASYKHPESKDKSGSRQSGPPGRSFSARARDRPPGNLNYTTRKPAPDAQPGLLEESTTPRGFPSTGYPLPADMHSQDNENQAPPELPSAPSRSNTTHSSDQRRDWASDRSPLQKLEVTLTGISKEEKRARVQEAELRLRERIARQKIEKEQGEVTAVSRTASQQSARSTNKTAPGTDGRRQRDDTQPEDTARYIPSIGARPPGGTAAVRHNRNASMNPQYPAVRRPEDPRYAHAENTSPSSVKMGSVPRRSVTMSGPSGKPEPGGGNIQHSRSVSHHGPSKLVQATPLSAAPVAISSAELVETPPTARAAQTSVESHTKPKKQSVSFNVPPPTPPPVFEWRNAPIARLVATDFDFQHLNMERSKAWWESGGTTNRRKSRALPKNYRTPAQKLTGVTEHKNFQPKLFLRCGPLLRYSGIKKVQVDEPQGPVEKDIWRGSVLIVTKDSRSSYENPPTLRLFAQSMDLLPPPPAEISGDVNLAPEYIDPTAGLMKMGRDGRPLYVKPVEHLEEETDLSAVENDDGIYELSPSITDYTSEGSKQSIPSNRIHSIDGETAGLYRDIPGARLYADPGRDVTFWKFNLEIELSTAQQRIAYRINQGPALGFWVPAKGQPMNIMFHSGNGFSPSADSDRVCGPDPLWRDILNEHQTRPFHVMIGGGDQVFNDSVITETAHMANWVKAKSPAERYSAQFTIHFRAELEGFYLRRYAAWFSQGLFSLANSQIPMVNIWNDHEILEGFGSYDEEFMSSDVVSGLGKVAYKYYLLFQHHSVPEETEMDEPSWLLGSRPGPYIQEKSRNLFMSLGGDVVLLGLDCRTERKSNEVLNEETCDLIWDRCHREIIKGETKHLIVLSSVPIAYPRVAMLKNLMNSRKSLGKSGKLGGLVHRSGGNMEIFDDHWAGKHLKSERTWLVEDLQDLAAEKSVRVTILSGDVNLAAIGQFYSNQKLDMAKDRDYRYMPNVISSAIAGLPETQLIADTLNKRNTVHHMDSNTDEDMIPIFTQDVDGKSRNNKRLLPRRNWCSIREYLPGSTPPMTPEESISAQEPRPGMLQRTLSLGRGEKPPSEKPGLLRRLSTRKGPPTRPIGSGAEGGHANRRSSIDTPSRPNESAESYFLGALHDESRPTFRRRPTNLSLKAAKKSVDHGDDGAGAFVDLEGGLAITMNMEISPQDPSGSTVPYKLLVPRLRYEGTEYDPPPTHVTKGWRKWLKMPRRNKEEDHDDESTDDDEDDDTLNNTRANAEVTHPDYQYEGYPGSEEESDDEVPQRLPQEALVDSSPDEHEEEPSRPRKKWLGVI